MKIVSHDLIKHFAKDGGAIEVRSMLELDEPVEVLFVSRFPFCIRGAILLGENTGRLYAITRPQKALSEYIRKGVV
jgi:hypothetical protein